ncbi:MAG: hypothetical protein JWQ96_277, partial [Segetibacter sp.]|nr:hypothetical protein [Segetibacter sp.]
NYRLIADTNNTRFTFVFPKTPNTPYNLILDKTAFADTAGATLAKTDTLKITTKKEEEYGSVKLRFTNLDTAKNPVLLLVQNDKVIEASAIRQRDWVRKLYPPGEYDLRILYDTNKNTKWDPGNFFGAKRQPEIVRDLKIKLTVRANWDNEKDIAL